MSEEREGQDDMNDKNRKIVITDEIVADALSQGKTVTDMLAREYEGEIADKIRDNDKLTGLDAFQFAMMDAGVTKNTVINEVYKTGGNEWLFPTWIDRRLREAIPDMNILPYLIGSTETVPGTSVQMAKLEMDDHNTDAVKRKRVAEGSDLPLAILRLGEGSLTLKKRGRAVQASYECYMYQTFDMMGRHLDMIANDVAGQQTGDAIDVLVNGDGNDNAAEVVTISGSNGLTAQELVKFAIAFWKSAKMPLNTIITGDGTFFETLMMTTFNVDEINGMLAGATFNFPQAQLTELNVLYDSRVPLGPSSKEQLIGLNSQFALTKYVAAGSQIREYDKNIRNQTNLGTVSEIANFGKFNDKASMILRAK